LVGLLAAGVVAGCGGDDDTAGATASTVTAPPAEPVARPTPVRELSKHTAGGYRLVNRPVVSIDQVDGGYALMVWIRLNKALPRGGANFLIYTSGLDATPERYGKRGRHCYRGTLGNDVAPPELREPRAGQVVPFKVDVVGVERDFEVRTTLLKPGAAWRAAIRKLGCT
jgi:hypothetical protein